MGAARDANGLTIKEESFARHYALNGNASESFRLAYDSERMQIQTIHRKAHDVLQRGKVAARIRELQAAQLAETDVTASDIVRVAWEIARSKDASHGSRVSALALLAKRHHEFSDKHEISSDVRLQAMQAVANMDEATLRALAESLRSGT